MFDFTPPSEQTGLAPSDAFDELRGFVEEHREGLFAAAELLGATPGLRLAQAALDGVVAPQSPTRRTMRALADLLDLLMLEHVHDPSRIEAARFARIDPASPVVEEICLLADGLETALASYWQATPANASLAEGRAA
ncbi:hypothetical protein RM543_06370 [Roseicyclus sp. F158]|uniref:Uncharacterized protein n=1 Tax=Tropicimonas omnivorans TaxID=3075590 RepID=A0ABU3DF10_9RHOB|nr:hypothetical protein [Roseicyclus sp. F158]MDT0682301.1 hypothetical protein [Roseicyclus sp. F158]